MTSGGAPVAAVEPGAQPAIQPQADGPPYRAYLPALQRDGFFPELALSQLSVFQGGAILVTAKNALSGTSTIFGREYLLAPGPEGIAGFVGFGTEDPPGPALVRTALIDSTGQALNYAHEITVKATAWTFDDIIIPPPPPPDPNAPPGPPPPPPPPNEQPILDSLYATVTERQWVGGFVIPIELGGDIRITGYFGEERSFNGGPRGGHHGGTDIGAPRGTPVRATNDGTVVLAGLYLTRGNIVAVDHGAGILSSYGHMDGLNVSEGDQVLKGQAVGFVGSTGLSTGPHLHWELAVGGVLVDGLRWLDGTQGF